MTFTFNIHKAIASTGYFYNLNGGKITVLKLVKMLYYADRLALQELHYPITGDSFASLKNGPIVSGIYDLVKGVYGGGRQKLWNEYIGKRAGHTIPLVKSPSLNSLSKSELRILKSSFEKIVGMSYDRLVRWTHKFPEWEDPGRSSKRIDPKTILKHTPLTDEEIEDVEAEVKHINFANRVLGAPGVP